MNDSELAKAYDRLTDRLLEDYYADSADCLYQIALERIENGYQEWDTLCALLDADDDFQFAIYDGNWAQANRLREAHIRHIANQLNFSEDE